MSRVRVLIVDDDVDIRRLVGDVLAADPDIEVVGTAANGRIALQKITQCNPDVVTMDVEMPDMNGIETVREVRRTWPKLPVIMFSTLTERGGTATLDALAAGASDYCTKPANVGSVTAGLETVRRDLIPKIKALAGRVALPPPRPAPVVVRPPAAPVVPFPVAVLIVQHMPPMFTRLLAERLNAQCAVEVMEGQAGMPLTPGRVYVAPGDYHMTVERHGARFVLGMNQEPPENSCRPAVDVLFRSVVQTFGGRTLGVILTGMGQDGLRGCELVREAGGQVIAQDEASSVVWGMPGFVARAGLADRVLPLDMIAPEITRRCTARQAAPFQGVSRVS